MTGITSAQYDAFFSTNYNLFRRESIRLGDEDLLHDVYLKLRYVITGKTITSNLTGYFIRSLRNAFLTKKKKEKEFVAIVECDLEGVEDFTNNQAYYNQLDAYTRYIFRFVEQRYTPKQYHVYMSYFVAQAYEEQFENRQTYQAIATRCGYSYGTVKQYVLKINLDIRQNFNAWLTKEIAHSNKKWSYRK